MAEYPKSIRCDQHLSRMVKTRLRLAGIQFETDGFRCAEPACTRHYTEAHGYFDVLDGSVLIDKFQQRCPKCETAMYLMEREAEVEVWLCPAPQCGHVQRMIT